LTASGVTTPTIRVNLLVFIRECRLKGSAMQGQLDHIACGEGVLWQIGEKQFGDDSCACHPNRALFLPSRVRGDDDATGHAIGSHQDLWTIGEAAHHLTFGTLL
jgi:hypothetical protein